MTEFYNFIGCGIIKTENKNCCRYCKYRASLKYKKNKIWCDYVQDVIPIGYIVAHSNCKHFKWNLY